MKKFLLDIPIIGYVLRAINYTVRSPKYMDQVNEQLALISENIESQKPGLFAENHLLDKFYTNFEDRFRGGEANIIEWLKAYKKYFSGSKIKFSEFPVLDIGSGRGEFLSYMKTLGVKARGVEINDDMVKRSLDKGLDVVHEDALTYLQDIKPRSLGAITGFHVVEHIPFETLLTIFNLSLSALTEDGFVIFETPNPENVSVGSNTFYLDPSHLKPIPPDLLAYTLEVSGFKNVKILRLHPLKPKESIKLPDDIYNKFYGPADYAVIGFK